MSSPSSTYGGKSKRPLKTSTFLNPSTPSFTPHALFTSNPRTTLTNQRSKHFPLTTSKLTTLAVRGPSIESPLPKATTVMTKQRLHPGILRVRQLFIQEKSNMAVLEVHPNILSLNKRPRTLQRMSSSLRQNVEGKVLDYYAPIEYCPPPVIYEEEKFYLPDLSMIHDPDCRRHPPRLPEPEDENEFDFPDIDLIIEYDHEDKEETTFCKENPASYQLV